MNTSLQSVRVIDLTTNVSGPFATQILGDLGADVIKVERPGTGDDTRGWGPPFWGDRQQSVTFSTLNRNKRSLALDLKEPSGRETLDRLIASADVLVQNMRPGSFERLGYSWDHLRQLNPRLIYCEITGFGQGGPRSMQPAYDPLMQAYSGLMSLTGEEGRPPVRIPVSILDKGSGMWAAIGVLNALRLRDQTGEGSRVHTSLLETALQWEPLQLMDYIGNGELPTRLGSGSQGIAPYGAFKTADTYIIVAAGNQRLWEKLCHVIERTELLEDPRFIENSLRFENRAALGDLITEALSARDGTEWVELMGEAGIPSAPINTMDAVVNDEHVQALGVLPKVPHPQLEGYTLVQTPITTNGEYFPIDRIPPALDADGPEILSELGYDEHEIAELRGRTLPATEAIGSRRSAP